jgi:hypothetical protein
MTENNKARGDDRQPTNDLPLTWICCACLARDHNATSYQPWKKPICTASGCSWLLRCKRCPRIRSWIEKKFKGEVKEKLIVEDGEGMIILEESVVVLDEAILIVDINEYVEWPSE